MPTQFLEALGLRVQYVPDLVVPAALVDDLGLALIRPGLTPRELTEAVASLADLLLLPDEIAF